MDMSAGTTGAAAPPGSDPAPGQRSGTALLIEDDADQRLLLTRLLQRSGLAVRAVATAAEALEFRPVGDQAPPLAVALLDLRLPDMDGADLLVRLREIHPDCPIVVCSVLDVEDYPAADGVLPKPVTSASLRAVLDGLFGPEVSR